MMLRKGFLLVAMLTTTAVQGHIEDICVTAGGEFVNQPHGHGDENQPVTGADSMLARFVKPFYQLGERSGCEYNEWTLRCILASVIPQQRIGFNDTSTCRGFVHFFSIYYIAASQGFKQEYAYFLAAFSQAIDFMQYRAVDSCGNDMDHKWWTPPMRGFLRTNTKLGGTQRHLGLPFVGHFDGSHLSQEAKQYTGGDTEECRAFHFRKPYEFYRERCPALAPNLTDAFYEGALSSARNWAFGDSDLLCIGGYTSIGPDGSPFTGETCPKSGGVESVSISKLVSGPIPLAGGNMILGEQYINYNCEPACACDGSCEVEEWNQNYKMVDVVLASQFGEYLKNSAPYATIDGEPVPELIARFGIYLHWIADRASHWYCCDASESGMSIKNMTDNENYNLNMYMSNTACNAIGHSMVHMFEQGMKTAIAPGSYAALEYTFKEMEAFKATILAKGFSDWLDPKRAANPLSFESVVGTIANPGELVRSTILPKASDRVQAFMDALAKDKLPPLPGFETTCNNKEQSLTELQ